MCLTKDCLGYQNSWMVMSIIWNDMIFICILCLFSVGHSSCWMKCKYHVDTHYAVLFRGKGQEKKSLYTDAIISDTFVDAEPWEADSGLNWSICKMGYLQYPSDCVWEEVSRGWWKWCVWVRAEPAFLEKVHGPHPSPFLSPPSPGAICMISQPLLTYLHMGRSSFR